MLDINNLHTQKIKREIKCKWTIFVVRLLKNEIDMNHIMQNLDLIYQSFLEKKAFQSSFKICGFYFKILILFYCTQADRKG